MRRVVPVGLLVSVVVLPIVVYASAPHLLPALGVNNETLSIREIPGRPALDFFFNPNKRHYSGAREFCEAALAELAPNSVLIVDYTVWEPLLYLQKIEGFRPDVRVALVGPEEQVAFAVDQARSRPVYVALLEPSQHYDRKGLEGVFRVAPAGVVYRLLPREERLGVRGVYGDVGRATPLLTGSAGLDLAAPAQAHSLW